MSSVCDFPGWPKRGSPIKGGRAIKARIRIFTRGRYVSARDLRAVSELQELVRSTWKRMDWGECQFEEKVRAMLDEKATGEWRSA